MAIVRASAFALLLWTSVAALGEEDCSIDGECSNEESSLLALRSQEGLESRRRLPPVTCKNRDGALFKCAGGDRCCGDACVGRGDVCCENTNGNSFPCQGQGGGCCGNACFAPGSKCCISTFKPKSQWYPVSKATTCASGFWSSWDKHDDQVAIPSQGKHFPKEPAAVEAWGKLPPVTCKNRDGALFQCAAGDRCCGDACVARGDVCCENTDGNSFPCQGQGGGCCGNACFAPGSKCCISTFKPKSQWYPVSKATRCASGFWSSWDRHDDQVAIPSQGKHFPKKPAATEDWGHLSPVTCKNRDGARFQCAAGDRCCGGACVARGDVCCENTEGDSFPCQGRGGGCCGNACFAPGSKCCISTFKPKSQWYPVSKATKCASGFWSSWDGHDEQVATPSQGKHLPEESSWLALRSQEDVESRRRLPPVTCKNRDGALFKCAGGDRCCGDACVGRGDVCCENTNGNSFPCQGQGGGCCGNACFAPGSKCCISTFKPKSQWYPVSKATKCASGFWSSSDSHDDQVVIPSQGRQFPKEPAVAEDWEQSPPVTCKNRDGALFQCAAGDRCCGGACVARGDVCCENTDGNSFPCQGQGGGCCGNACFAPGSKCCSSTFKPKSQWYPVSKETKCASGFWSSPSKW